MYILPRNETVATIIARSRLGVYAAKFTLLGNAQEGRWQYRHWDATIWRLDTGNSYSGVFKQGIGITRDPTTADYLESLALDADVYEQIAVMGDDSEFAMLQRYIQEYGYDKKDPDGLQNAMDIITALEEEYPQLEKLFGPDFDSTQVADAAGMIFNKTGKDIDDEGIWKLICIDPATSDTEPDELDDIELGNYDIDEINRRYELDDWEDSANV